MRMALCTITCIAVQTLTIQRVVQILILQDILFLASFFCLGISVGCRSNQQLDSLARSASFYTTPVGKNFVMVVMCFAMGVSTSIHQLSATSTNFECEQGKNCRMLHGMLVLIGIALDCGVLILITNERRKQQQDLFQTLPENDRELRETFLL
jgi:hypothetical protein